MYIMYVICFSLNEAAIQVSVRKGQTIKLQGQSRGLPDWVNFRYMYTKSIFMRLRKKHSYFSAQDCVKVSPGFASVSRLSRTTEVCTQSGTLFRFFFPSCSR